MESVNIKKNCINKSLKKQKLFKRLKEFEKNIKFKKYTREDIGF